MLERRTVRAARHDKRHWTEVWPLESPAEPALCRLVSPPVGAREGDESRKTTQEAVRRYGKALPLAPHPLHCPRRCRVHSQGRGLLGVADRQKRTPDLQLTDSSDELTQRETTAGCEGEAGATSACTMKSPSAPGEAPEVVSDVCPK